MSILHVVTTAGWLAEDLAAGTPDGLHVRHHLGLDLPAPSTGPDVAYWCPGAFANRLTASGVDHPFLAAGPAWLDTVPAEHLGRRVETITLGTVGTRPAHRDRPVFAKLAEAKHQRVPAGVYPSAEAFRIQVAALLAGEAGWPAVDVDQLHVQLAEPLAGVRTWVREYRVFVADGQAAAASLYLRRDTEGMEQTWDGMDPEYCRSAAGYAIAYAQSVLGEMPSRSADPFPPGFVLDVGVDADGRWSVIEANASWSSNPYHCEPAGVVGSVLAGQRAGHEQWEWAPDRAFARLARPLAGRPASQAQPSRRPAQSFSATYSLLPRTISAGNGPGSQPE